MEHTPVQYTGYGNRSLTVPGCAIGVVRLYRHREQYNALGFNINLQVAVGIYGQGLIVTRRCFTN
jgi:hypothetical protein